MSNSERSFLRIPQVAGILLIALGALLGIFSWLSNLSPDTSKAFGIAGLTLPMLGFMMLGFAWLFQKANLGRPDRQPTQVWGLYPLLGFGLGSIASIVAIHQAYPGAFLGLILEPVQNL